MTKSKLALAIGLLLLLAGCAGMDAEDRDFYRRNVLHPGMDSDERVFWYGWMKPGGMEP